MNLKETAALSHKFYPICIKFSWTNILYDRGIKDRIFNLLAQYNTNVNETNGLTAKDWLGRTIDIESYDYSKIKGP